VQNLVQPFERREENLFTALASGDPPEVLMASRAEILRFANDGLITSIDDYVTANNLDLSRFYDSEIGNFYWKDKLYSMPMPTGGGVTSLTLVNYDMLRAAGHEDQVPATWAELEEMSRAFTELDDKGIVKIGATVGTMASDFFGWLYCNSGAIYNDDLTRVDFANEQGVQTLEWMVNFTNEINGGVQNVIDFFAGPGEATEAQPWYNDAQLINFPNVSIFFHMQTYKPEMQWDMGLRPYNADNPAAKSQGLSGEAFAWGYVVPNVVTDARREAALKWLQKITYDEDGGGWFMMQQGRPSPIKAVNEDPSFYEVNPHWDKVLKSLESDVSVQILPVHAQVRDIVTQGVQAAMFGDASPAEALTRAAEQAQAVVDSYWSQQG
jgi:multiple sugar transport system substrate-binding protein